MRCSCPAAGPARCLPSPVSYSRDHFGQETSEQQRGCQGEVVKSEQSGNLCMKKAGELGSRTWAHGKPVWGFTQLFAAGAPELSRFPARRWDALAEMLPCRVANSVFSVSAFRRLITRVRRSMEQCRNEARPVPWAQREQSPPQLWAWCVAASWHRIWGIKNYTQHQGEAEDALTAAHCSYPS